jgi:large subunit ribosomal protein L25
MRLALKSRKNNTHKMKTVVIEAQKRTSTGKKAARDLRSQGQVLGVIYGGKEEIHFSAPALAFRSVVYTPEFLIAEIKIDGTSYRTILKDVQFDVVTDQLNHVDFLELVEDKKLIANLPLKFVGQSEGVKAGGRFEVKMKTVKVRAYPKDLVENIEVDITGLQLNGNLRVQDIKSENLELMNSPRQPIASVVMTRALRQAESEEKKGK